MPNPLEEFFLASKFVDDCLFEEVGSAVKMAGNKMSPWNIPNATTTIIVYDYVLMQN